MVVNSFGKFEITNEGYNYLKDKQINQFNNRNSTCHSKQDENADIANKTNFNNYYSTLINLYEDRLNEMKENYEIQLKEQKQQVEYFKTLYESEKSERIKVVNQYNTYLLDTAENNNKRFWQFWK